MYIIGIDGGGTKTHCVIGDKNGNILAEGFGGPANHQIVGAEMAGVSIVNAIKEACDQLDEKITFDACLAKASKIILGLAGADQPSDFVMLNKLCESLFGEVPFTVYNDTWIGLRSGSEENYGVISICGTGAAHAGCDKAGNKVILRNIDYLTGNIGGGGSLVTDGLHYAFRSDEQTHMKTSLEDKVLEIFEADNMDEVCDIIQSGGMTKKHEFKIPVAVFQAANDGDLVATRLIHDMGQVLGECAAAIVKRLGLHDEAVPMVLIGSVFKTNDPILIKPYMEEIHKVAAKAYPVIPDVAPAYGAYYMGLDELQ